MINTIFKTFEKQKRRQKELEIVCAVFFFLLFCINNFFNILVCIILYHCIKTSMVIHI